MSTPARGEPGQLAHELEPTVRAAAADAGFDLDSLDVQAAGRRKVVRVVLDSDDGVDLDEMAQASRAISEVLEEADEILGGPYTLEVTSPGVDRPLTQPRHWRRAHLRQVRITPAEGKEYLARVGTADETGATVLVGKELRRLEFDQVSKAVVEVEFKQPPAEELKALAGNGTEEGTA
ncbi:ribosome maturation factor RimP [Pseudonocardiaceae bacterium YIM PH 21723]|nr:ribosome maturation factor RimP [Pseudonocardiaceae bacterium YIM PH 21723]